MDDYYSHYCTWCGKDMLLSDKRLFCSNKCRWEFDNANGQGAAHQLEEEARARRALAEEKRKERKRRLTVVVILIVAFLFIYSKCSS